MLISADESYRGNGFTSRSRWRASLNILPQKYFQPGIRHALLDARVCWFIGEKMYTKAYIGLGSNVGDKSKSI